MLRIFCCRSRKTSRVEVDRITDSLETCLSDTLGVAEFDRFLSTNNFVEERKTLEFALKCERTLRDIRKLSPGTIERELPYNIRTAISQLYGMINDINFSAHEKDALGNLLSNDIDKKIQALETGQRGATDLLQETYTIFKRRVLANV